VSNCHIILGFLNENSRSDPLEDKVPTDRTNMRESLVLTRDLVYLKNMHYKRIFSIVRGRVRHLPNIASGKFTGALLYQCRDWQDLVGTRNAIINVNIKADPQFSGDCSQGHEGIPGFAPLLGAWAKAGISFANSLSAAQFGRVIV